MLDKIAMLSPSEIRRLGALAPHHPDLQEKLRGINLEEAHAEKRKKHPIATPGAWLNAYRRSSVIE